MNHTTPVTWHPHTERPPSAPMSCIIALPPEYAGDISVLCAELHTWDGKVFSAENSGEKLEHATFFWLPEKDLLAPLEAAAKDAP